MSVAVRTQGEPPGPGTFVVPSATFPGEVHTVFWQHEAAAWCACLGFMHRGRCRHVEHVALAVEIEARQLGVSATPETRAVADARLDQIAQEFGL